MHFFSRFAFAVIMPLIFLAPVNTADAGSITLHHPATVIVERIKIKTPLTFCGETVPIDNPDVKERLEREMLISVDNTDDILLWLKRANRYFPHIEKVLKAHGLPDDLKYIAIAESSLRPQAASGKGAVGYWQFIEATGMRYGLMVNSDIDERRNVFTSTEAAAKYLKDLYAMFGSWTLAAAAYNMGEDGLQAEIIVQKVGDYYRLHLFQETQRYIFRILAAKIIMSDPSRFGYVLAPEDLYEQRPFDVVEVTAIQPIPIHLIAEAANTYFKVIRDLNPQLRNYNLPAGSYTLHIPRGSADGFPDRYARLIEQWLAQRDQFLYTVQKGDNLSSIAARFNVPLRALMIWNNITNSSRILPGNKLYIFSDSFQQMNKNGDTPTP